MFAFNFISQKKLYKKKKKMKFFSISIFFLLISLALCKIGLLTFNSEEENLGNGFGYYTQNFDLKNITSEKIKRKASLNGITSIRFKDEEQVIGFGRYSFIKNQKRKGLVTFSKNNTTKFLFEEINSNKIDYILKLNDDKLFLVGEIYSYRNIPAQNCLICDLKEEQCKVLNDGKQIGLINFYYLISISYDPTDQIIYLLYYKFLQSINSYGTALVTWNQNSRKKKFRKKKKIFF